MSPDPGGADHAAFEHHRRRCVALAYRIVGSAAEAEDIVQEAWLRWQRSDGIVNPGAWLTTTVTRLCLDHLKSARVRRETYVGPWLPEPVDTTTTDDDAAVDPETISMAFMLMLERLSPAERAVFLLHRVFDVDYAEIASMLGKTEVAVRQLHHRAKSHLADDRPRYAASKADHLRLLTGFLMAVQSGELAPVEALLAEDVQSWNDGGGRARAARKVVAGRSRVAKFYLGIARKGGSAELHPEVRELNGWPALLLWRGSEVASALTIETDGIQIFAIHTVVNPAKLGHLASRLPG